MGLMPRPYTLDQQPATVLAACPPLPLFSFSFSLCLARFSSPNVAVPPPSRALPPPLLLPPPPPPTPPTPQPTGAARGLKYAVDKKQVCRQGGGGWGEDGAEGEGGGIAGETSVERVQRGELKTEGERRGPVARGRDRGGGGGRRRAREKSVSFSFFRLSLSSSPAPFFFLFFSLSLRFSRSSPSTPAVLSTIRYISGHPRHCFRGISSELFARDSFRASTSLAVPILPLLCLFLSFFFPSLPRVSRARDAALLLLDLTPAEESRESVPRRVFSLPPLSSFLNKDPPLVSDPSSFLRSNRIKLNKFIPLGVVARILYSIVYIYIYTCISCIIQACP